MKILHEVNYVEEILKKRHKKIFWYVKLFYF